MNYCFFTPSYRNDLERLLILRQSIKLFIKESLRHYVIVPKNDFDIFKKSFADDNDVMILKQEDFVPKYFYPTYLYSSIKKLCPNQTWRFNKIAGRPGWIIQQIVKLCIPEIISEDVAIILDSDVLFIKPVSIYETFHNTTHKSLTRIHLSVGSAMHSEYVSRSRVILKLPVGNANLHYMSWPAIWYKDWVVELQEYLFCLYKSSWQEVLYKANIFSEYNLYGIFIEEVLKPKNLSIIDYPLYTGIWHKEDFNRLIKSDLSVQDQTLCVVIQSNMGIPVNQYKEKIDYYLSGYTNK
jgi:hypothetical protein